MKHRAASTLSLVFLAVAALPAGAQNQIWIRQLGTIASDTAQACAPDGGGGVYVAGETHGNLGGPNTWGNSDAWLARYDSSGNQTWVRQLGTNSDDFMLAAAAAGTAGMYVCGFTLGDLGGPNAGAPDAWLARYDGAGNRSWVRQLGTSGNDQARAAAPDGTGGVYVSGQTSGALGAPSAGGLDIWVARYDSAGNRTWICQFGSTSFEYGQAAAPDSSGGVYVAGYTFGSFGGPLSGNADAWMALLDSFGNQIWLCQIGTSNDDIASAAASDGAGGAYIGGSTGGSLGGANAGSSDAWLARYDSVGNQTWIRQLGSSSADAARAVASDGLGGAYVAGYTYGSFGGPYAGGLYDAWVAHYDSAGNQIWLHQLGTTNEESASGLAPDGSNGMYIVGSTGGSLGGPSAGGYDAWLAHYDAPCSTTTSYCAAGTTTHGCVPSAAGTGSASASAGSGFAISISNVEGAQSGLIFYGLSGAVAFPWGTGTSFMCVKPPLERTPVQNSGGTYGSCNGVLSIDWNLYIASNPLSLGSPFVGGELVRAQAWFRDPPSPKTTNLSNGLSFSVCP